MYNPLIGGAIPGPAAAGQQPSGSPDLDRNYGAAVVIDGTPVRVVMLALSAAIGLTALRWAGFRFNVGVSS